MPPLQLPIEPLDGRASGSREKGGDQGVREKRERRPEHDQSDARGDAEMLTICFTDAPWVLKEKSIDHPFPFRAELGEIARAAIILPAMAVTHSFGWRKPARLIAGHPMATA